MQPASEITIELLIGLMNEDHGKEEPLMVVHQGPSWKIAFAAPLESPIESGDVDHILRAPLSLHAADTPAYIHNLQSPEPSLFMVIRPSHEAAPQLHLTTLSPFEAESYLDGESENIIRHPLSSDLHTLLTKFIEEHKKPQTFIKRKRTPRRPKAEQFGKTPVFLSDKERLK